MKRREFLRESAGWLGGALIVSWSGGLLEKLASGAAGVDGRLAPNPFVAVGPDGRVVLVCHRSEMGQGVRTSIAMLLADELEVELGQVTLAQADGDERYGDQNTDGSKSIVLGWTRLREAGAAAREMLVAAAAAQWRVPAAQCRARQGRVFHEKSGKSAGYGELVSAAAGLEVPQAPKLKPDSELRLIGKAQPSLDLGDMLMGRARFGIDVVVPGMVYASLERAPTVGGRIRALDEAGALAVPGVVKVVKLKGIPKYTNEAVAVVATSTWAAISGRRALKIEWESGPVSDSAALRATLEKKLETPGASYRSEGDIEAALKGASKVIEARYRAPYLAHATMEPLACTARFNSGQVEIWAPSQDPQGTIKDVAEHLGLDSSKITLHVTFIGGGFGRKSQPDFVIETVALARELRAPVKITWTREDELRHGFYHPESAQRLTAALDHSGKVTGWRHRSAFTPIAKLFDPGATVPNAFEMGMGASNMPYHVPNFRCEGTGAPSDVRVAWLRSVCNIFHAFSVNSFMDEIAHATGRDPVQLRLDMLEPYGVPEWDKNSPALDTGRLAAVLKLAAHEAGWGRKLPHGQGLGIACHYSFKSYVAVGLKVRVAHGRVKVEQADIVIDCGRYVNADCVRAQMEGSVVFGLSAALHGEITLKAGQVEQSNFHEYQLVRMPDAPPVRVHLIESQAPSSGVGEPGVPPVAPALCSAIFQATGKRIRDLPVTRHL